MKYIIILLFVFFYSNSFAQTKDGLNIQTDTTKNTATIITKFDIANATKDGFYINGYVVNIDYEKAKKLNGKKIKVTGKVTIVKGIKNQPNKSGVIKQGRATDTKYIDSPLIEIMSN